ncbi:YitT family protein [Enterococcus hailinensis]|uniref:YitT family protein n=1 Tax=Enterococcus hailinensis TaxID=3238988 RepID=UPI0038B3A9B3
METTMATRAKEILFIIFGTAIYAFGLVYLNIANDLAEGGVTGITLIIRALFGIDPAYTTLIINIPLILIGGKILGKRSFYYTILGTISLSVFLWIWQRVTIEINLDHDLFIVSILAGLVAGFGSGLVYRNGGTTGGADVVARILEQKFGFTMGKSLLVFDIIVLICSLTYLDLKRMMYTLIVSFVFSKVVDVLSSGGYAAKGVMIISNENNVIAELLMSHLERGVTYLHGEGGFSSELKRIVYIVVSPQEINEVKKIVHSIDDKAFISITNVHDVDGEGFTFLKPQRRRFKLKRTS